MTEKPLFLEKKVKVVNIGLKEFADSLKKQDIDVVHVAWVPPAGGDREILRKLDRLI